ncbi:Hypothetical protein AA314_01982 [Archangium gephyra]|uniref:Uncharacterized protein n=1 Tax=Archangium gephyra TaxID=48 RepID=A0AAC8Q3K6_9BACT|nr:Hypothetical protein AA314_01982 [Archangium gephyra]
MCLLPWVVKRHPREDGRRSTGGGVPLHRRSVGGGWGWAHGRR